MFREWAMAHTLWSLVFLPMGLFAGVAVAVTVTARRRGRTLFRAATWFIPLFFLEAVYYAWILDVEVAPALAKATGASVAGLLWAGWLDHIVAARTTDVPDAKRPGRET